MLRLLALVASAAPAGASQTQVNRPTNETRAPSAQPRQLDFCALDSCNCPWADKEFIVPEAGGMGPFPDGAFSPYPRQYVAYRVGTPPAMDGRLDDPLWEEVAFTDSFIDISTPNPGRSPQDPPLHTAAKIRWDDEFMYVGALMEEPNVWANLTEQNSIIFYDPDFEVFVDPAGCNHQYKEFEMNAKNTTWDLLLNRPYNNGGTEDSRRIDPINGWTMLPPLYCAAHVNGPINDPAVENDGWSVEIALPIASLMERQEAAGCGADKHPAEGVLWRLGFSRVNWHILVEEDPLRYVLDPDKPEEDNWTWSAQGSINMHLPEFWGYLQFSEAEVNSTVPAFDPEWPVRSVAMGLYWAQSLFMAAQGDEGGVYAGSIEELAEYTPAGLLDGTCTSVPAIELGEGGLTYVATVVDEAAALLATVTDLRLLTVEPLPAPVPTWAIES